METAGRPTGVGSGPGVERSSSAGFLGNDSPVGAELLRGHVSLYIWQNL